MAKDRIKFRNRGESITRIDGFSDVVFGFALTLLVVSLEVPHTFRELMASLQGFVPFSICFFFLIQIWYVHYRFFRRYGLEDFRIIVLNSVLLFVVLLFVYPLKFLFTLLTGSGAHEAMGAHDGRMLLVIYGCGFAAVWLIFGLMHREALARRAELALNPVEALDTKLTIGVCFGQMAVALLSIVLAETLPDNLVGIAGFAYMLIGATSSWAYAHYGKQRRSAEERMLAGPDQGETAGHAAHASQR